MSLKKVIGFLHLKICNIELTPSTIHVFLEPTFKHAKCTLCGNICKSVHSFYICTIQDLPLSNKNTCLHLTVRRFFCKHTSCHRKIFSEQYADVVYRYKRRSNRVTDLLSEIMLEVFACKGSLLSGYIRLKVSPSTCLRLVKSLDVPIVNGIKHLGVDDWAFRKGLTYGTAVINMDSGKIVDLLEGRDGSTLKTWLVEQKDIETVNRDRAGSYSSVIKKIHPQVMQIADRFHLIKNLGEHVDFIINSNAETINSIVQTVKASDNNRYLKRKKLFDKIKRFKTLGYKQGKIAKIVGVSRFTVWKYFQTDEPVRKVRHTSLFDPYKDIIEGELAKGRSLHKIFNIIKEAGYPGARSNFYTNFGNSEKLDAFRKPLTLRKIATYMFFKDFKNIKCPIQREQIKLLNKKIEWFSPLNKLCVKFNELLKEGNEFELQQWLTDANNLCLKRMSRFVAGIIKDYKAVLNAVLSDLSSW